MIISKLKAAADLLRYNDTAPAFVYGLGGSQNYQMDSPSWSVNVFDVTDRFNYDKFTERQFAIKIGIYVISEFNREPDYYDNILDALYPIQEQFLLNLENQKTSDKRRLIMIEGEIVTQQQHQIPNFDAPVTGLEFTFRCKLTDYRGKCIV